LNWLFVAGRLRVHTNTITNALTRRIILAPLRRTTAVCCDFSALVIPGVLHHLLAPRVWWRLRACLNRPSGMEYGTCALGRRGGDHSLVLSVAFCVSGPTPYRLRLMIFALLINAANS